MISNLGNPLCLAHIPNFAFRHLPPKLKKDVVNHLLEFVSRVLLAVDTLTKCARMLASLNPLSVGHPKTTTTTRQGRQIPHCQQRDQCNSMWTANKCTLLRFISVTFLSFAHPPVLSALLLIFLASHQTLHCWFLRLFCFLSSYMK